MLSKKSSLRLPRDHLLRSIERFVLPPDLTSHAPGYDIWL
jgi:hypothetical protein